MPTGYTGSGAQFTFEDDQIILDSVGQGMGYPEIAQKYFPNVDHRRIGDRYNKLIGKKPPPKPARTLNPNKTSRDYHRHNWTPEEDKLILDCRNQGMEWTAIVQRHFPTFKRQRLA